MRDRRLYEFFNDRFEAKLPLTRTMEEAYTVATNEIWDTLQFTPYKNYESFIRLRKAKKKVKATVKKSPQTINQ